VAVQLQSDVLAGNLSSVTAHVFDVVRAGLNDECTRRAGIHNSASMLLTLFRTVYLMVAFPYCVITRRVPATANGGCPFAIASAQLVFFQFLNPQGCCPCVLGGIRTMMMIPTSEEMKMPRTVPRTGLPLRTPSKTHIVTLTSQRAISARAGIADMITFDRDSAR